MEKKKNSEGQAAKFEHRRQFNDDNTGEARGGPPGSGPSIL
jgi:hypothetical protein